MAVTSQADGVLIELLLRIDVTNCAALSSGNEANSAFALSPISSRPSSKLLICEEMSSLFSFILLIADITQPEGFLTEAFPWTLLMSWVASQAVILLNLSLTVSSRSCFPISASVFSSGC